MCVCIYIYIYVYIYNIYISIYICIYIYIYKLIYTYLDCDLLVCHGKIVLIVRRTGLVPWELDYLTATCWSARELPFWPRGSRF